MMKLFIDDLENRVNKTSGKFDLLKLKEEIAGFIGSSEFRKLVQSDKNRVEDLLVKVIYKGEKYKVYDPWKSHLNR